MDTKFAIPDFQTEGWRFTDLTNLTSHEFTLCEKITVAQITHTNLAKLKESFLSDSIRLVILNGNISYELSDLTKSTQSIQITDTLPQEVESNLKPQNFFTNLNKTYATNKITLNINGKVDYKVHVLNITTTISGTKAAYPQLDIIINKDSTATLIEEYLSFNNEIVFTNTINTITLQQNATLNHTLIQNLDKAAFYMGHINVALDKNSNYITTIFMHGSRLSRLDTSVAMNASYANLRLNGLTLINDRQIADVKTTIYHNSKNTTSTQMHKSIVDDGAHSIFNGKICVAKDAAKTDANQQNRSLMLGAKSRITTEPKLEINNQDVVCTHGATISQLDEDILFFLKSRGIGEAEAKKLCIKAFANEVISKILATELVERFWQKLEING